MAGDLDPAALPAAEDPPERQADGTSTSRVAANRARRAVERHKMVTMLVAGATEREVAEALTAERERSGQGGRVTEARVSKHLVKLLERWEQSDLSQVDNLRAVQIKRLEAMIRRLNVELVGSGKVRLGVVDRLAKYELLLARIAGTEKPQQHVHSGTIDHRLDREEVDRLEQVWLASVEGTAEEILDAELVGSGETSG